MQKVPVEPLDNENSEYGKQCLIKAPCKERDVIAGQIYEQSVPFLLITPYLQGGNYRKNV